MHTSEVVSRSIGLLRESRIVLICWACCLIFGLFFGISGDLGRSRLGPSIVYSTTVDLVKAEAC